MEFKDSDVLRTAYVASYAPTGGKFRPILLPAKAKSGRVEQVPMAFYDKSACKALVQQLVWQEQAKELKYALGITPVPVLWLVQNFEVFSLDNFRVTPPKWFRAKMKDCQIIDGQLMHVEAMPAINTNDPASVEAGMKAIQERVAEIIATETGAGQTKH